MQPQGPPGGPYNPGGQPVGPNGQQYPHQGSQPYSGQPPYPAGTPYPAGQQYPAHPPVAGQTVQPGYPGQPVQPGFPGQHAAPQPMAQPGANHPPASPYQNPQNPAARPGGPEMTPAPAAAETPYDFFMQPKPATPMNPLPVSGRHLGNIPVDYDKVNNGSNANFDIKKKLPVIAGGGVALVILLFALSFLTPEDKTAPQLFNLAQIQQEIVRVCSQGASKAKYRSTRYFAITCSTGITTNQKDLLGYMSTNHMKYNSKQLGAKASDSTDSQLKSALSSSTYDDTFRDIVSDQLGTYDSALTQQLGTMTGEKGREVLSKSQSSVQLLMKMVADDSDKTEAAD